MSRRWPLISMRCGLSRLVPRMVPPTGRIPASAALPTPRMAALSPGLSPPAVMIPIRFNFFMDDRMAVVLPPGAGQPKAKAPHCQFPCSSGGKTSPRPQEPASSVASVGQNQRLGLWKGAPDDCHREVTLPMHRGTRLCQWAAEVLPRGDRRPAGFLRKEVKENERARTDSTGGGRTG